MQKNLGPRSPVYSTPEASGAWVWPNPASFVGAVRTICSLYRRPKAVDLPRAA